MVSPVTTYGMDKPLEKLGAESWATHANSSPHPNNHIIYPSPWKEQGYGWWAGNIKEQPSL